MHILLVADGRSPITQSWIKTLLPLGYRISLVSTYPCAPVAGAEVVEVLPVAFARFGGSQAGTGKPTSARKSLTARFRPLLAKARHALGPWTVPYYRHKLQRIIAQLQPDVVHAMRIPYEGMLAAVTPKNIPMAVSTWGNDFTLHAAANPVLGQITRQTMARADALFSDTQRDVELAKVWGFDPVKPALVVVGNGGLDLDAIRKAARSVKRADPVQIFNPRGLRSYVRSDTFFQAIPLVLNEHPQVRFVCASMAGQKEALDWINKLGIEKNVDLLPFLSREKIWEQYARSTISVSISEHDGTPNTLLEAMAFGCLPVCGDIESIREWIKPGVNGVLVPPDDPTALAAEINHILANNDGYDQWRKKNDELIRTRADRTVLAKVIDSFYRGMVQ